MKSIALFLSFWKELCCRHGDGDGLSPSLRSFVAETLCYSWLLKNFSNSLLFCEWVCVKLRKLCFVVCCLSWREERMCSTSGLREVQVLCAGRVRSCPCLLQRKDLICDGESGQKLLAMCVDALSAENRPSCATCSSAQSTMHRIQGRA